MKVSIWQQFSSNHSASFTVAGNFETPERAQAAAAELRVLMNGIVDFYTIPDNKLQMDSFWAKGEISPLTPIERDFAERFGIAAGQ